MKTQKKSTRIFRIAAMAFAMLFIFSAILLVREFTQKKKEAETFSELSALRLPREEITIQSELNEAAQPTSGIIKVDKDGDSSIPQEQVTSSEEVVSMQEKHEDEPPVSYSPLQRYLPLYELNPDFFAWITVPDTRIDYPVMYNSKDPLKYLGHDFYGNRSYSGVPFMDSDCDPNGNFYLVYGHKMNDGSMFADLVVYEDRSFWETHATFTFDTLYEERTYVVVAAMRARVLDTNERTGFRYYYYTSLDTEEEFDEYMKQVRKLALYETGIDVSFGDELLVLSTCYHYTNNGRFVVIGKRVEEQ